MEQIVAGYVKVKALRALEDMRAHRQELLLTLTTLSNFDAMREQHLEELRMIEAGIAQLTEPSA